MYSKRYLKKFTNQKEYFLLPLILPLLLLGSGLVFASAWHNHKLNINLNNRASTKFTMPKSKINSNNKLVKAKQVLSGVSITSFSPTTAGAGTTISIIGSGFTGATGVSFGGQSASSFTVIADNQIAAVVATGAGGSVSVTGAGGTGTLAGFVFLAPPAINYQANQTYGLNVAITPIMPNNTGGEVPANVYGSQSVFAAMNDPGDICSDPSDNLFVFDQISNNYIVKKISPDGTVSLYAGGADLSAGYEGFKTSICLSSPYPTSPSRASLTTDAMGNVYVSNDFIIKISSQDDTARAYCDVNNPRIYPRSLTTDLTGNLYIADNSGFKNLYKRAPTDIQPTILGHMGNYSSVGMVTDASGSVYFCDRAENLIKKITPDGFVSIFAGIANSQGNVDGPLNKATFADPVFISKDIQGNLYVYEFQTGQIRKISTDGIVSTIVTPSIISNGGLANDTKGNLYLTTGFSKNIIKVNLTGYSVSPALPAGLNFDATTGIISGTPTALSPKTTYTVTAANIAGSSTSTFDLEITNIATWTGNGNDSNWNNVANWDLGFIPSNNQIAIFSNSSSLSVNIPAGTNLKLNTLNVTNGTNLTLVAGGTSNTLTANTLNIANNSGLQITSGSLTMPKVNADGNFTLNGCTAQIDSINVNSPRGTNITGNSAVTITSLLNVTHGSLLNISNSSQITLLNISKIVKGTLINNGTVNTSGSTINLSFNGPFAHTVGNQINNFGTFNSTTTTFNLAGLNSQILNNPDAQFNCSTCQIICPGGATDAAGNNPVASLQNNGIFLAMGGTQLQLNGTNSSLYNSTIQNAHTAYFVLGSTSYLEAMGNGTQVINDVQTINGIVSPTAQFILNSDKDNSAFISQSANSLGFDGLYYVQRYFTGNNSSLYRGYRLISSPVNSLSPTQIINNNLPNCVDFSYLNKTYSPGYGNNSAVYSGLKTAGSGSGFSAYNKNPLIYLYNETLDPSNATSSATATKFPGITSIYPNTASSLPSVDWVTSAKGALTNTGNGQIPIGNGLLIYFIGPNARTSLSASIPPDDATVSYLGYINQGDITVYPWFTPTKSTLSYTNSAVDPNIFFPGTNLVGNPYPATIDLQKVQADNPTFTTFTELTDVSPQGYVTYGWDGTNETTSSSNASRYIATGQGFFVTAIDGNQTLTFHESQKVYDTTLLTSNSNPAGVLVNNSKGNIDLKTKTLKAIPNALSSNLGSIHLMVKKDSLNFRETGIYFNKNWTDNYGKGDAMDLDGLGLNVFLSSYTADGARVGINGMGDFESEKKIKLYVKAKTDGTYSLQISDIKNIDQTLANIYLIDNFKKTSVDFGATKTYNFDIVNADTTTYGSSRFVLSIQRKPYQLLSFKAQSTKSNINLNWQTQFEGNFTGFGVQKLNTTSNSYTTIDTLQSNGSGNYEIKDPSAQIGNNTYRLVQNNINGNAIYSTPLTIKYGLLSLQNALGIFPNPVADNVLFDFSGLVANPNKTYTVNVFNSLGHKVFQSNTTNNFLNTNLSTLNPGLYIVQIQDSYGTILGKSTFIKK